MSIFIKSRILEILEKDLEQKTKINLSRTLGQGTLALRIFL